MSKENLLTLIEEFEKETWGYSESNSLYMDMEYIYKIENILQKEKNINLKELYNKLIIIINIIRMKHGFESVVINNNPDLIKLKERLNNVSLDNINEEEYENIKKFYETYIEGITNLDFLEVPNISHESGKFLAIESMKDLITNLSYRELINKSQITEMLRDYIKLINGKTSDSLLANKYSNILKKIWSTSLKINRDSFKILFSNISGGSIKNQVHNLLNRPFHSSCSMISSDFLATYGTDTRRIGFIYPNDSDIVMASAYDLNSNVFGKEIKNKEQGTMLVTPKILQRIGIERSQGKNEDLLFSNCYNEVIVSSKPNGMMIIGFGEKDLNIDYDETLIIANELNLPLYEIDILDYKDSLSAKDKEYIAYHCVLSYMNIDSKTMNELVLNGEYREIFSLINENKEIISNKFLELKKSGILNKENMRQALEEIIEKGKNIVR